ncbi:2-oxo-4-hydroxy-4-carboxy-5-ureidoimidazoline decarboxylase [Streptomyces sp. 8L]|nr:2-oxo-4-hydroxy-4-carboxy-5-ureidoimidazoline decarboxylase [Streptomyces sp. 8L]MCA1218826.1 2-oxo-4-hydroxy-4-carboxy-5-ureidoimidazoline decarboxylase [Streptomyces sp. 8L]
MRRFNGAPADTVHEALLRCCGSDRWARRIAAHRPYPDVAALLAAADEAAYDLTPADLGQALAAETAAGWRARDPQAAPPPVPPAALTALRAAFAAYEASFGHTFVISLEGRAPEEYLDQVLAGIRARLGNDPEEERVVAAEELRRLSRTRLGALVARVGGAADGRSGDAPERPGAVPAPGMAPEMPHTRRSAPLR